VRIEPREDAPIAGRLPIGTLLNRVAPPAYKEQCPGFETLNDSAKWICVYAPQLETGSGAYWGGWIAADLLGSKEPRLGEVIAQYDATPREDLAGRRKWAERAAALDPLSGAAQERLLAVLADLSDDAAIAATKRSFTVYEAAQPDISRRTDDLIFAFTNGLLEPIGEWRRGSSGDLRGGRVVLREFDARTKQSFHRRGNLYRLHSRGQRIGVVVTEAEFNCAVKICPRQIPARGVYLAAGKVSGGLATNYWLQQWEGRGRTPVTPEEERRMFKIARDWASLLKPEVKTKFVQHIDDKKPYFFVASGQLYRDKGRFIVGNWVMGSVNDQHHGDEPYESLLIIVEHRENGEFSIEPPSGSIAKDGCRYFDHADLDEDGTDEIVLKCEQLEGQYGYALLRRIQGNWKIRRD